MSVNEIYVKNDITNSDLDLSPYVYDNYNEDNSKNTNILRKNIDEFLNSLTLNDEDKNHFLSNFEKVEPVSEDGKPIFNLYKVKQNNVYNYDYYVLVDEKGYPRKNENGEVIKYKESIQALQGRKITRAMRVGAKERAKERADDAEKALNEEAIAHKYYKANSSNKINEYSLQSGLLKVFKDNGDDIAKLKEYTNGKYNDILKTEGANENLKVVENQDILSILIENKQIEINTTELIKSRNITNNYSKGNYIGYTLGAGIFVILAIVLTFIYVRYFADKLIPTTGTRKGKRGNAVIIGFVIFFCFFIPMIPLAVIATSEEKKEKKYKDEKKKEIINELNNENKELVYKYKRILNNVLDEYNKFISVKILNDKLDKLRGTLNKQSQNPEPSKSSTSVE